MKYVIEAGRAGAVLDEFVTKWKPELTAQVRGVVLDFKLNRHVDELCLKIAGDPEIKLSAEPRELRALLAARINLVMASTMNDPDAEVLSTAARLADDQVLGEILKRLVMKAKLPKGWDGQRFEP